MRPTVVLALLLALGCQAGPAQKVGPEEDPPVDGALDSFRSPVDHGALTLGGSVTATLSAEESFHAWTFDLAAPASVALRTADGGDGMVDTVLYLYRARERGWGPSIARNDDDPPWLFSALSRELEPGRYRVLVKGYDRGERGAFRLVSECEGEGCVGSCLFGGTYRSMRDSATFDLEPATTITDGTPLESAQAAQLLAAVRVAYEDAADLAAALGSVDEGEVHRLVLRERASERRFVAYEYGAGDNSYGAVFEGDEPAIVAQIQDGDLYACMVPGVPAGGRAGVDCGEDAPCGEGLSCTGFLEAWQRGRCAPTAPIAGEGTTCEPATGCGDALLCSGEGVCVAQWLRGSIGEGWALEIPDDDAVGLTRSEPIYGVAPVVAEVRLRATIQHRRPTDVRVIVTSPSGTEQVVAEGASELDVLVAGFDGEPANGFWSLHLIDRRADEVGSLERWTLDVTSRRE